MRLSRLIKRCCFCCFGKRSHVEYAQVQTQDPNGLDAFDEDYLDADDEV